MKRIPFGDGHHGSHRQTGHLSGRSHQIPSSCFFPVFLSKRWVYDKFREHLGDYLGVIWVCLTFDFDPRYPSTIHRTKSRLQIFKIFKRGIHPWFFFTGIHGFTDEQKSVQMGHPAADCGKDRKLQQCDKMCRSEKGNHTLLAEKS